MLSLIPNARADGKIFAPFSNTISTSCARRLGDGGACLGLFVVIIMSRKEYIHKVAQILKHVSEYRDQNQSRP